MSDLEYPNDVRYTVEHEWVRVNDDGTVTAVNEALDTTPELVNSDPYGEGWIYEVRPSNPADVDALMDAATYQDQLT